MNAIFWECELHGPTEIGFCGSELVRSVVQPRHNNTYIF